MDACYDIGMEKIFLVLQNVECEGLGSLADILTSHGYDYNIVRLAKGEKAPKTMGNYAGLIILGGPMNVYQTDQFPFLLDADRLIKQAGNEDKPLLGICLGSQLIAKALDTKVYSGEHKEIGWLPISLSNQAKTDPLFSHLPPKLTVFQWHGDTFNLPQSAIHLASSDLFQNQDFRLGQACYALQFHLEVTGGMVDTWLDEYQTELDSLKGIVDPHQIQQHANIEAEKLNRYSHAVFSNFLIKIVNPIYHSK
ncbi:TPA: type 1 glutamine amidotransferase [Candidatus Poribacteria bacterium]|nr:type 1 glutamine amidotransferase [Candidatus Poribacteria bacterium]HIB91740.1 type 1 glutamine amidotransferase [Candidatus Poribacteria bacterium]HIN28411.1 type 1 glutamine amidotransferase [Candidatus Poribacteria bacterium]